jgi:hypothetical protein
MKWKLREQNKNQKGINEQRLVLCKDKQGWQTLSQTR